jgi:Yeast cell wall synthesis protein KRE9/KNH1
MSVATKGGTVTNYSGRFTISGMTGVFPAAVLSGMKTVSTLDGPTRVAVSAAATPVGAAGFDVPYSMQTGPIMYAPMQSYPGTAITNQGKPKPLYPTSPYTLATTFLPPNAVIQKTITEPITWSFSHVENTVKHSLDFLER